MGFCKDYDYYGPDWASSWPSGSSGGVSGPPAEANVTAGWDATGLSEGPLAAWEPYLNNQTHPESDVGPWTRVGGGDLIVASTSNGVPGISFRFSDPLMQAEGGIRDSNTDDRGAWMMVVSMFPEAGNEDPSQTHLTFLHNGVSNRGVYFNLGSNPDFITWEGNPGNNGRRLYWNDQLSTGSSLDTGPFGGRGATWLIGTRYAARNWNFMGNIAANNTACPNCVFHEVLWWEGFSIQFPELPDVTDEMMDAAYVYLRDKWAAKLGVA